MRLSRPAARRLGKIFKSNECYIREKLIHSSSGTLASPERGRGRALAARGRVHSAETMTAAHSRQGDCGLLVNSSLVTSTPKIWSSTCGSLSPPPFLLGSRGTTVKPLITAALLWHPGSASRNQFGNNFGKTRVVSEK